LVRLATFNSAIVKSALQAQLKIRLLKIKATNMTPINQLASFHDRSYLDYVKPIAIGHPDIKFTYTFENFFHPLVSELVARLNKESLPGMMDAKWQLGLTKDFFNNQYKPNQNRTTAVEYFPKEIDVSEHGPYANYNWELFYHIPLTIAVHLSKNQRFAEAQQWFHYVFDPTSNDQSEKPPARFWKFLAFRKPDLHERIEEIVRVMSIPKSDLSPADQKFQDRVMQGYDAIRNKPFQPHAVARTRHLAYQYSVVMKYLDNLIAWGDHLFQQDTLESINEATQIYVLAANILGTRPQKVPSPGTVKPQTFAQLKKRGLGLIGDGFVELQGQITFNLISPTSGSSASTDTSALFGIGRTLYFCIPRNEKLLGYWDTVSDRLFKIRHCMNIAGVVRSLSLFDPPIDPGMLVKAASAGIDISSIVSGLNQPIGPVRCIFLIQKSLELCAEVRGLGNALLAALEKGDAEHLALIRQRHEIQIQQMAQEVRFLQWKSTQEATTSLLTSRKTTTERLKYYQRLLGLPPDQNAPDTVTLDRRALTKENFDEAYAALVTQYDKPLTLQKLSAPKIAADSSSSGLATLVSGSASGQLYLNTNENNELNSHLPRARDMALLGSASHALAAPFTVVPDAGIKLAFWGLGADVNVPVGRALVGAAKVAGDVLGIIAGWEREQAGMASRSASYQRRADDWMLQYNLAAHELMQNGRQILSSLISEQVAHHEYENMQQQIKNAQEVDQFFHDKFTNEDLHLWMQGEISRLYYEYYRFAFDTARKAEKTMKQELMRTEVDAQDFVKFNYWDGGRKGLLSGEALYLDVKRMEMAYHENNKRELELTKHISLRQLDPVALLELKTTGECSVTVPEWLYDLDCPGHYMRRIKYASVSIPAVVGSYTSVNCTVSLLNSSLRKSPLLKDGKYLRQGSEDDRFIDYKGAIQSMVTSNGQNDSGLFETNLRDERFLPFEGAGVEGKWKLDLPNPRGYPAFDYATITDVILHVRYTARQGLDATKVTEALKGLFEEASQATLALAFNLRYEFATEWVKFVSGATDFSVPIRRDYFPYFVQGKEISITGLDIYDGKDVKNHHSVPVPATATDDLKTTKQFMFTAPVDANPPKVLMRKENRDVCLIIRYTVV
jgi:Tc toxin complex TcA C-terminal TcB-binding domain